MVNNSATKTLKRTLNEIPCIASCNYIDEELCRQGVTMHSLYKKYLMVFLNIYNYVYKSPIANLVTNIIMHAILQC